ncbi:MAG: hypothetical protein Q4C81_09325 [Kocuria sp.]|nr:hypothetical protein [Kocuria sp.]
MEVLPLSMGQFDLLNGTYGRDFANQHAMMVTLSTSSRFDLAALRQARNAMVSRHAPLRMRPNFDLWGADGCVYEQRLLRDPNAEQLCPVVYQYEPVFPSSSEEEIQTLLNRSVTDLQKQLNILTGPLAYVLWISCRTENFLTFIFSHYVGDYFSLGQYIRTFINYLIDRRVVSQERAEARLKKYLINNGFDCSVGTSVTREVKRLAAEATVGPTARLDNSVGVVDYEVRYEQTITEFDGRIKIEEIAINAISDFLTERLGERKLRIDLATHGRGLPHGRGVEGWAAHAVPQVTNYQSRLREFDALWPRVFSLMRIENGPKNKYNFLAHAFVNYITPSDPRLWGKSGFRVANIQPANTGLKRKSYVPIRLKIMPWGGRVNLSWEANPAAEDIMIEIISSVSQSVTSVSSSSFLHRVSSHT